MKDKTVGTQAQLFYDTIVNVLKYPRERVLYVIHQLFYNTTVSVLKYPRERVLYAKITARWYQNSYVQTKIPVPLKTIPGTINKRKPDFA